MMMSFGFGDDSTSWLFAVCALTLGATRARCTFPLGGRMPLVTGNKSHDFRASVTSEAGRVSSTAGRLELSTCAATGSESTTTTNQSTGVQVAVFMAAPPPSRSTSVVVDQRRDHRSLDEGLLSLKRQL